MGLLNKVLENCKSNVPLEENAAEFVSYFRGVQSKRPIIVSGMEKFTMAQAKKIIDFVYQGYDKIYLPSLHSTSQNTMAFFLFLLVGDFLFLTGKEMMQHRVAQIRN